MKIVITIEVDGENVSILTDSTKVNDEKIVLSSKEPTSYYAAVFNATSPAWTMDAEYNLMFLRQIQRHANDVLRANGHLFLNDVHYMLGLPKTKIGQIAGWVYDEKNPIGDNFVDFGLEHERNHNFINGLTDIAILDFNVDGNILDRI